MLQISKIISFTMKLDLVDHVFLLSELFIVRDLSVYIYIYIYMELVRHNLKHVWELTISEATMGIETRDVEEDIF